MSKLRIRIKLNEGGVGAPLSQLVEVLAEAEKFFRYLAQDVGIQISKSQWLTTNFENGSLGFDAESGVTYHPEQLKQYNHSFSEIARLERGSSIPNGMIRHRTVVQYARIGEKLQPHEKVQFGLYRPEEPKPFDWKPLSHRRAVDLSEWFNESVDYVGSLQGVVHSVVVETPKSIELRPVAPRKKLIRCEITEEVYKKLVPLLEQPSRLLYLRGNATARRVDREILSFRAFDVIGAPPFSREKFFSMLGSAPAYTGGKSTEDAVDEGRNA